MVKIHTEKHNSEKMFLGNVCNSNIKELCDQYSAYDISLAGTKFISWDKELITYQTMIYLIVTPWLFSWELKRWVHSFINWSLAGKTSAIIWETIVAAHQFGNPQVGDIQDNCQSL